MKKFKVKEMTGSKVTVEGHEVDKIQTKDFVVFRTKQFLTDEATASFLRAIEKLEPEGKAILLPPFIEVCEFVEE